MKRWKFELNGVVQGVGFRPYVYTLAQSLGLGGFVGNDSTGVFIEIEGERPELEIFQQRLLQELPPLAHIEEIRCQEMPAFGENSFQILESSKKFGATTLISPDLSICDDCLAELFDPSNKRYLYPFINCTNCGPRFTIIRELPYDRFKTTMADFPLCSACEAEYKDPHNRRFHAQPNACPTCGPQVEFIAADNHCYRETALDAARKALVTGQILAIKGLGGFHLACDASNTKSVQTLRERKQRVAKPFAIMVYDLTEAEKFAYINAEEASLLTSRQRPIVLLKKRTTLILSDLLAPNNPYLGIFLPYTPLHYLLLHELGIPLVMTSGNLSEEPIIYENELALEKLSPIADAFLLHNRPIHVPCDDSVLQPDMPIRRSRGYAPFPIKLPFAVPPLLAVGGELKNTFCLAKDQHAFMSQHIGDMENLETVKAFEASFQGLSSIFAIKPEIIACDMQPNYLSTRWAQNYAAKEDIPLIAVQHHHAHIAAVMAENSINESVLGFSFDGTGYGTDGAIWGGEILKASYSGFERLAHLAYVPLAGGDNSIKKPYRMALAHLWAAGIAWDEDLPPVQACSKTELRILRQQFEQHLNLVPTSSMGRLFDAVASLIGLRQQVSYEAQAAVELEAILVPSDCCYCFSCSNNLIQPAPILRAIIDDLRAGISQAVIAGRFHHAVIALVLEMAKHHSLPTIALSGGVFQNTYLRLKTKKCLEQRGYRVLLHHQVPTNDAGLALGQALIASSRL